MTRESRRGEFQQLCSQWLRGKDATRTRIESEVKARWKGAWHLASATEKEALLSFIARLRVTEAAAEVWESLTDPEPIIRSRAIEAVLILVPRFDRPLTRDQVDAVWRYALTDSNRRRVLALMTLDLLGELRADERFGRLSTDPDPEVVSFVRTVEAQRTNYPTTG